ncbi:MAG: hypothetical protein E7668_05035 [Ruminococcaceae bacterium]|nr:hypothetical protein [Oscillospiraceae bacterium]
MQRPKSGKRPHLFARYLTLGLIFAVLCAAFLITMAVVQLREGGGAAQEEGYIRTYTVPGVRGEIYDRNGVLLVGNSTGYDLIYEYGAMPDTRREVNLSLLATVEAILETGNGDKLSADCFVLEGTYPKMKLTAAAKDKDSNDFYHFERFCERNECEATADGVMSYLKKRYKLSETLYTDEEITHLMRLYYEMERADFGAYASYTVAKDVNREIITRLEESNIEGVNFEIRAERVYPYPGVASHILGQLGRITAENADYYLEHDYDLDALVGLSGCEAAFEEWLRGKDGTMVIRYDDRGNQIEKYYETEPQSGNDVYLTIDIDLQRAAEDGLKENVEQIRAADAGAITVLDPDTGEVLAIASYPTYDLTRFDDADYYASLLADGNLPLYNRALQGVYAPGSTYKIGAALAALETNAVNESVTQTCTGIYPHLHNPTCLAEHGEMNVVDAIRESCNVFFYYLGESMGIDAMTDYTRRLGLGTDTGIELSERTGIVAGSAYREENGLMDWQKGDDLSAAIGQSDHGYTPLQLSVYVSSVVNGGTRYNAHLLDSVRAFYTGEILQTTEPQIADRVTISDPTYALLIEAMGQVVSGSDTLSGYFKNLPCATGGKTGTAEVDGKEAYAIYCGFAPLEDPELVVSCIIEEGAVGSRAALAVSRVMEEYFRE